MELHYRSNFSSNPCTIARSPILVVWVSRFRVRRRTVLGKNLGGGEVMPRGVYPRVPNVPRLGQRHRRSVVCLNCQKVFERPRSDTKRRYCSRACFDQHYRGENHPLFKAIKTTTQGYDRTLSHRTMAEKALGRRLKPSEVVHHINGIKRDNTNSNLLICTVGYHQWLHMRMSQLYMQEHFSQGGA